MPGTHTMTRPRFHLAFPVDCLSAARQFFIGILDCKEGRSAPRWVDFDFYGHQLSAHLRTEDGEDVAHNQVDGDRVPDVTRPTSCSPANTG